MSLPFKAITATEVNGATTEAQRVRALFRPREREVWASIANGKSTKEIADELKLKGKTIEHYRASLYLKLDGARNMADLTRMAIRYGIIAVEVVA